MHTYYEAKEMLQKELEQIVKKGELSAGSLETIDKLLNSIKNACKIIMYDEYSEEGEYSQEGGGMSYARGRGQNARRDSMGRYSRESAYAREGGNSYNSYARGGRGGRGGYSRGYSYDDGEKEEKIEMLREMMGEVSSEEERRALQKIIRKMEQE